MQLKIFNYLLSKINFCLLLFFILSSVIFTQVRIKEKIIIKPDSIAESWKNKRLEGISPRQKDSADLEIKFSYSAPNWVFLNITAGGKSERYVGSGSGETKIVIPGTAGNFSYSVQFLDYEKQNEEYGCYSMKKYFNEFYIDSTGGCGLKGWGQDYLSCYDPDYTFLRKINLYTANMSSGEDNLENCSPTQNYSLEAVTDNNICEGGDHFWDPEKPVQLTVNSNYAAIYNSISDELTGTSVSAPIGILKNQYNTIISKLPYDAQPTTTTITASQDEITASKEITLIPMSKFIIVDKQIPCKGAAALDWDDYCDSYQFAGCMGKANFEIITSETGVYFTNIYNGESAGRDLSIFPEDLYRYLLTASIVKPFENEIPVVVKCTMLGQVQYDTTYILPPAVRVSLFPSEISPGDTAGILIEKWDTVTKSYKELDSLQNFEIGVVGGCDYGQILNREGILSNYYPESNIPVRFVAADSLDLDSAEVTIRVNLPDEGGTPGIARNLPPGINKADAKERSPLKGKISSDSVDNKELKNTDKNTPEEGRNAGVKSRLEQQLAHLPENIRNKIQQRLEKQKKQEMTANVMSCAPMGESSVSAEGSGSIEEVCDLTLPELDPENVYITFQLNKQNNNYSWFENPNAPERIEKVCEDDPNKPGSSKPIEYTQYRKNENGALTKSWILDPYFEKNNEVVQSDKIVRFRIIDPDTRGSVPIYFDFVSDMCWENIDKNKWTIINNKNDLKDYRKISNLDEAKQAIRSFRGHSCYSQIIDRYFIVEITEMHEKQHMDEYCQYIEDNFSELEKQIINIKKECIYYDNDFKNNSEKYIVTLIKVFIETRINGWNDIQGKDGSKKREIIEKKINSSIPIIKKIIGYMKVLKEDRYTSLDIPKVEDFINVCPD